MCYTPYTCACWTKFAMPGLNQLVCDVWSPQCVLFFLIYFCIFVCVYRCVYLYICGMQGSVSGILFLFYYFDFFLVICIDHSCQPLPHSSTLPSTSHPFSFPTSWPTPMCIWALTIVLGCYQYLPYFWDRDIYWTLVLPAAYISWSDNLWDPLDSTMQCQGCRHVLPCLPFVMGSKNLS